MNFSKPAPLPFGNEGTRAMSTSLRQLLQSMWCPEDSEYQLRATLLQRAVSLM